MKILFNSKEIDIEKGQKRTWDIKRVGKMQKLRLRIEAADV